MEKDETICPACGKRGLVPWFKGQFYYGCTACGWKPGDPLHSVIEGAKT